MDNTYLSSIELFHKFFENARGHDVRNLKGKNPFLLRIDGREMYIYIKNLSWAQLSTGSLDNWRVQLPIRDEFNEIKQSDKLFVLLGYDKENHVYTSWNPYWCKQRLNVGKSVSLYSRYSLQKEVSFSKKIRRQELQNGGDVICIPERQIYQYLSNITDYYPIETTYIAVGSSIEKKKKTNSTANSLFESFINIFNKDKYRKYLEEIGEPVYWQTKFPAEIERVLKYGFLNKYSYLFLKYNSLANYKEAVDSFLSLEIIKKSRIINYFYLKMGLYKYLMYCAKCGIDSQVKEEDIIAIIKKGEEIKPIIINKEVDKVSPKQEQIVFPDSSLPNYKIDKFGKLISLDAYLLDKLRPMVMDVDYPDYQAMAMEVKSYYPPEVTDKMTPVDWMNLFESINWKKIKVDSPLDDKPSLRVTMHDGRVIQHKRSSDTFVEVIENCFPDLIADIDFGTKVISKERFPDFDCGAKRSQVQLSTGHWLSTHSSNSFKAKILRRISDELELGLKVEVVGRNKQIVEYPTPSDNTNSVIETKDPPVDIEDKTPKEEVTPTLQSYIKAFENLKTSWRASRKAPHKAILLLTIIELYEKNLLSENVIRYDEKLKNCFSDIWNRVLPKEPTFVCESYQPYWYLQTEGFWHLVPVKGMETTLDLFREYRYNPSESNLYTFVQYAKLDEDLYKLMQSPSARSSMKRILLKGYTNLPGNIIDQMVEEKEETTGIKEEQIVNSWTEGDDELLRILYVERQCPVDVLAAVFKKNNEEIETRIKELELNDKQ